MKVKYYQKEIVLTNPKTSKVLKYTMPVEDTRRKSAFFPDLEAIIALLENGYEVAEPCNFEQDILITRAPETIEWIAYQVKADREKAAVYLVERTDI